jgi:four helix bundle protein
MDQSNDYKGGFETLEAWKIARNFRIKIRKLALTFPDEEKFMLKSQIIRSSRSIGNNIAEGYGRFNYQETIHFCRQGRGSLTETLDHLHIALECEYIGSTELDLFRKDYDHLLKLINGYIAYLKRKKNNS